MLPIGLKAKRAQNLAGSALHSQVHFLPGSSHTVLSALLYLCRHHKQYLLQQAKGKSNAIPSSVTALAKAFRLVCWFFRTHVASFMTFGKVREKSEPLFSSCFIPFVVIVFCGVCRKRESIIPSGSF